jgi:serine/threonine protein kinase
MPSKDENDILGTAQYTAPEYFLGESSSPRSDIFSLGVITYQMLTGRLPYGAEVAKAKTRSQQRKLRYASVLDDSREIPAWIDDVLGKSVQIDPFKRYAEPLEYVHELRHPNKSHLRSSPVPLMERNPLLFWKSLTLLLAGTTLLLLLSKYR